MYSPSHFQEDRPEIIRDLIDQFPLATIVYQSDKVLCAEHVPLILDPSSNPTVRMLGHVAKGNDLWRVPPDEEVLVIFQGPSLYVSPNWYATKSDGGKVVPTWNYVVVHATCKLRAICDPERLLEIVTMMTDRMEASQPEPWRVTDAPATYVDRMLSGIVGLEFEVLRWQGKWKVSQNQPEANQHSLVNQLSSDGSERDQRMAGMISRYINASNEQKSSHLQYYPPKKSIETNKESLGNAFFESTEQSQREVVVLDGSRDSTHVPNGMGVRFFGNWLGNLAGGSCCIRCQFSDLVRALSGNAFRS